MNEREFTVNQISRLKAEGIKVFPNDFCDLSNSQDLNLPDENLVLTKDFFGSFEITTTNGATVLNVKDLSKAKFVVYSSRKRLKQIKIPKDIKIIAAAVEKYEEYLDELLTKIKSNYIKENFESKDSGIVLGEIFKKLNLTRL